MPTPPTTAAQPTCLARIAAELKRLLVLAVIAGLVVIAGKYYCFDRLDEEIRARVEKQLREHYRGLSVSVKSARRVAGQGLEIRGVRIAEAGGRNAPVLVEIGEILAECDTRLPDFLTRPPAITAVHVQRLKLRGERKPSGLWNLAHLIPLPATQGAAAPSATISDASLEIVDPSADPACSFTLRNIELRVQPEIQSQRTVLHVRGALAGDHLERIEIDGLLDPASGDWDVRGAVEALEFSPRLRAALPRELSAALAPLSSIRGRTKFACHAQKVRRTNSLAEPPILFTISGSISEGRIDDARLPEPLSDVEARIRIDNYGVQIEDLSARCGATQIELNASLAGFGNGPIDITELNVRQLTLERWPLSSLPPQLRETWDRFSPRGVVDIAGRLQFDGSRWRPNLTVQCRGLSVLYDRFPYRLTDGTGTIDVGPDNLSVHLKMQGGGRIVSCDAVVQRPGRDFLGWIDIRTVDPIPIDDKLLEALEPAARRIVRSFEPRGSAQLRARFQRGPGDPQLHRLVTVQLHDCTIRHERFTYPIDKVHGFLELKENDWQFRDLTGRNDSAVIRGSGYWLSRGELGRQLVLDFQAQDVPLADELREALPKGVQRLWSNLRPRGNIDRLQVRLTYTAPPATAARPASPGQWSIEVQADKPLSARTNEGRPITLEPAWFRYTLDDLRGGFHYKDGKVKLTNLHAVHGQANISAAGECRIQPDGSCQLDLTNLCADQVQADNDLLAALPPGLSQSLTRFPLGGPLNLRGKLQLTVAPQPDVPPQLEWGLELDIVNGRLATPTPLESLHGGLLLWGRQGREGLFSKGELQIDSAIVRGVQLTGVSGPFFLDGRKLVFGRLAEYNAQGGAPRQVTANLLGGKLALGGEMDLDEEGRFRVQLTLDDADLADIARHAASQQRGVSGRVFAVADIRGTARGKHTWEGDGEIHLRDADIYRLPLMIRLLSLLSVKPPDRSAFTTSDIDLLIEGEDLNLTRIDFSGDAISLKGHGTVTGQRQIDLKFYPVVGREERQWPLVGPLFGQTGRELMLIEVTGTLDRYDLRRTPFPRLDERLQQLFPELVNQQPEEPNVPVLPQPRQALNPWNMLRQR